MRSIVYKTITEQVYEQIRDAIRSGILTPGTRIDQAAIARNMGASLVPVREALARLQADGVVEIIPHRGAFVVGLERDELIDISITRELLEQEAARVAATKLSEVDLDQLAALLNQMDQATQQSDYDRLFALNREFHFIIYNASKRNYMVQMIAQLWDQADHHRRVYTEVAQRAQMAAAEHRAIYNACVLRDADALGYAIRHHVHQTTVELIAALNQTGLASLKAPPTEAAYADRSIQF
jgi:DNA-binding GntR family transcriptional regulator